MLSTRPARWRTWRAFTLIEVLVVVAIIAVLTAMVVPAIRHARALARRSSCMANLKSIYGAYTQMRSEQHIAKGRALTFAIGTQGGSPAFNFWQNPPKGKKLDGAILPYLHDNFDYFVCPEDEAGPGNVSGFAAEGLVIEGLATASNYGDPSNQWGGKWWIPLYESKASERYKYYDGPPGSYQLIGEDNVIGGDGNPRQSTPGVHPEPGDSDRKGWNILLEITEFSGKPAWLKVVWMSSSMTHNLLDKHGNMIMRAMAEGDEAGVLQGSVSYGVNSLLGARKPDGEWIMALDYPAAVAHCTGAETGDDPNSKTDDNWDKWWDEDLERYTFARHIGQLNALHINGSVSSYFPKDINPHPNRGEDQGLQDIKDRATNRKNQYWNPPPPRVRFDKTTENDHTDREDDPDAPGPRW